MSFYFSSFEKRDLDLYSNSIPLTLISVFVVNQMCLHFFYSACFETCSCHLGKESAIFIIAVVKNYRSANNSSGLPGGMGLTPGSGKISEKEM